MHSFSLKMKIISNVYSISPWEPGSLRKVMDEDIVDLGLEIRAQPIRQTPPVSGRPRGRAFHQLPYSSPLPLLVSNNFGAKRKRPSCEFVGYFSILNQASLAGRPTTSIGHGLHPRKRIPPLASDISTHGVHMVRRGLSEL